jgi:tetraacyldisaccharide 4'-kinase
MDSREVIEIMSGKRRGIGPAATRAMLAVYEVPYRLATQLRNLLYDRRILPIYRLPSPAISVGNLTTGGTGKTPLVCWIAAALQNAGMKPAVLMRGYKSKEGQSDEAKLIADFVPGMPVIANPDRVRGAAAALEAQSETNIFILDDAMQHRRVARGMEIVLVSAVEPWGFGHLLPRGLLRESISGLKRAHAVIITHSSFASPQKLSEIESVIRRHNAAAPIFHADHVLTGLLAPDNSEMPMSALADCNYFVACGIGQPDAFLVGLSKYGNQRVGLRIYGDHHSFSESDVSVIQREAAEAGAAAIVVTEKDWTKLADLPSVRQSRIPFWRARLSLAFSDGEGQQLLELIARRTAS